ncbi:D-isomer specific 2-hydroxyacid dehydrogenase [Bisporella sp. PMI_857]|nr:D-isomer specific 2-hydroxyacid dehydrogenase [Bisporella sp. PMI_857]
MPPIPKTPIKIAILDDYQGIAAPHFAPLKPQFDITVFKDTLVPYNHVSSTAATKEAVETRLKPFNIVSAMRERTAFPATLLEKLPNLKLIVTTGYRNAAIDLDACKKLGIKVTGAGGKKGKGTDSTTEHCVALILGIARNLAHDDKTVKEGGWQTTLNTGLGGKTFGTLGLGRLGVAVAKIMHQAFGTRVVAWSSSLTQEDADKRAVEAGLPAETDGEKTFLVVSKEDLFRKSDIVSIHYVLSQRSKGIVGKQELEWMKSSALFVNTSRGPLVVEEDLLDVLEKGKIRGAAIDVFDLEPLAGESRWRTTKWGEDGRAAVLLTPHTGYVEEGNMGEWFEEQVRIIGQWSRSEELSNVLV